MKNTNLLSIDKNVYSFVSRRPQQGVLFVKKSTIKTKRPHNSETQENIIEKSSSYHETVRRGDYL